jgi:hypothetical protein
MVRSFGNNYQTIREPFGSWWDLKLKGIYGHLAEAGCSLSER